MAKRKDLETLESPSPRPTRLRKIGKKPEGDSARTGSDDDEPSPDNVLPLVDNRFKELMALLADAKPEDSCDENFVDPCLNTVNGSIWDNIPPCPYIPCHFYRPDLEHGVMGWMLGRACGAGDGLFTEKLYQTLMFFRGGERLQNPLFVDPTKVKGTQAARAQVLHFKYNSSIADPGFATGKSDVLLLANVALIVSSDISGIISPTRKVKELSALFPAAILPRLQSIANIAFDTWDDPLCSNIRQGGIPLATRPLGTNKGFVRKTVVSGGMPTWSKPPKNIQQQHPSPSKGSSLGADEEVPIYDAREIQTFELESEKPYANLPRFSGELEKGDAVWIGYGTTVFKKTYERDGPLVNTLHFNILWVVLLGRTGEEGFEKVYQGRTLE